MERNVVWHADEAGFGVNVRHGIRVIQQYRAESLAGDAPAAIRQAAAAKAIELALEHRIELSCVREARVPLWP
ncbi:MAG TPA: hypothetical protein PJ982_18755 [Lacipirellulaceae bacterium]|nr:hypothetical protein [Lacipirellulaceae bacterium]